MASGPNARTSGTSPESFSNDKASHRTHYTDLTPQSGSFFPARAGLTLTVVSFNRTRHTVMILPQVHLRKPCYDFYFL